MMTEPAVLRSITSHLRRPSCAPAAVATGRHVAPLDTTDDGLEEVGGKGRSLARMANAGLRVPGGFICRTSAYRSFVATNNLQGRIVELAAPEISEGVQSFEAASLRIQEVFAAAPVPESVAAEIKEAYAALGGSLPLAVRSSANAEDLPGLSFAGQHSSFLNVKGADEVVAATKACWASLWSAQALAYRHQNGVDHGAVAMAVVAQQMIPSDVSGILFTANPATGERSEVIINSSFGLGEAVVSGTVTPDTFVVDRGTGDVETSIGPKESRIVSDGEQGVRHEETDEGSRSEPSLDDAQVAELVRSAEAIEKLFAGPQDIEWGINDGVLHLLQSRPITNLPPPPLPQPVDWTPPFPAKQMIRRQIVENMPDPLCPLFEELYLIDGQQEGLRRAAVRRAAKSGQPDSWLPWTHQMDGPHYMTVNG